MSEREYVVLSYTAWTDRTVRAAEREARREIDAAVTLGEVRYPVAPITFGWQEGVADWWYEACFGLTEQELVDQVNAAARLVRRTRVWCRRRRREALAAYIRAHARLNVAHGLETVWH